MSMLQRNKIQIHTSKSLVSGASGSPIVINPRNFRLEHSLMIDSTTVRHSDGTTPLFAVNTNELDDVTVEIVHT